MQDISIILVAIIALQWIFIIYKDTSYTKERKDLLNRIMAKDTRDYKQLEGEPQKNSKSINGIKKNAVGLKQEDLELFTNQ